MPQLHGSSFLLTTIHYSLRRREKMAIQLSNIVVDCLEPKKLAEFWAEALHFELKGGDDQFVFLANPNKAGTHILFQKVPEPRTTKNRVHFDLHTNKRDEEVARISTLGATKVAEQEQYNLKWAVMNDPEGNVFCIVQDDRITDES
jgi:predicted enzyme related to lactoylglutathione lyase